MRTAQDQPAARAEHPPDFRHQLGAMLLGNVLNHFDAGGKLETAVIKWKLISEALMDLHIREQRFGFFDGGVVDIDTSQLQARVGMVQLRQQSARIAAHVQQGLGVPWNPVSGFHAGPTLAFG